MERDHSDAAGTDHSLHCCSLPRNAGYFDKLRREVDRRHPATAFGREIAGRAAEAATDLEHVHPGLYACSFRMLAGCRDTPAVQLVERP